MNDTWNEKKIKPRLWYFYYTKHSKKRPKLTNGSIKATQYAIKTSTNHYNLILKGILTAKRHSKRRGRKW